MAEKIFISSSEEETTKFADDFAKELKKGEIILLNGDLGSGKSVFARGVIRSFGVKKQIPSPTFTIVNEYDTDFCKLYHFDMYRLEEVEEAIAIGVDEIFEDKESIKLVEWPEKVWQIIPNKVIKVNIEKIDDTKRKITVEG